MKIVGIVLVQLVSSFIATRMGIQQEFGKRVSGRRRYSARRFGLKIPDLLDMVKKADATARKFAAMKAIVAKYETEN